MLGVVCRLERWRRPSPASRALVRPARSAMRPSLDPAAGLCGKPAVGSQGEAWLPLQEGSLSQRGPRDGAEISGGASGHGGGERAGAALASPAWRGQGYKLALAAMLKAKRRLCGVVCSAGW